MLQIIQHTPLWVFVLFFFLVFLGYTQTKDRKLNIKRVSILPIVMLFLSFLGVISAFGVDISSLVFYSIGLSCGIFIAIFFNLPRNSEYLDEEELFFVKGSYIPFVLIMGIFAIKYFVGVVTAREFAFIHELNFILTISTLYGLFSGVFFGRLFVLLKLKKGKSS